LGANNPTLNGGQHLLRFGQAQAQMGDIAQVTRPRDFHHIRAPNIATSARFYEPHNPGHAGYPTENLPPQIVAYPFLPPNLRQSRPVGSDTIVSCLSWTFPP
jgi:hypothetical protein